MRVAISLTTALFLIAAPAAADPITGLIESFFHYREPPPPVGGDCAAITGAVGPDRAWYGEFSGRRLGHYERYQSYAAKGCFPSEAACRFWQQQAITYADGPINYTSCPLISLKR